MEFECSRARGPDGNSALLALSQRSMPEVFVLLDLGGDGSGHNNNHNELHNHSNLKFSLYGYRNNVNAL